jgi:alpha-1,3-rhamnosyl/mannosyltransferase
MNICIDMRPALSHPTGVGSYLQNLIQALSQIDQTNQYHLFCSSWKERYPPVSHAENFKIQDRHWPVRILNYTWNHFSLPTIEALLGAPVEVVHSPTPLVIPSRTARSVTTVHDLYFYRNPGMVVREMKNDFPRLLKKHCLMSDAIIAVSDYTKRQLIELLNVPASRIYTIKHGVDPFFEERADTTDVGETIQRLKIPGPYLLFVGTQEPRKNLTILLEAYREFEGELYLVVVGPPGWGTEINSSRGVILTGYLSKKDLRALYQKATAVVFPSIDEGFGLPLVEAMASEAPLIASRIPAFQEVCGDSCVYFDPSSSEELTQCIRSLIENESLRQNLIAKGKQRIKKFSWNDTAQKTLDLYMSL